MKTKLLLRGSTNKTNVEFLAWICCIPWYLQPTHYISPIKWKSRASTQIDVQRSIESALIYTDNWLYYGPLRTTSPRIALPALRYDIELPIHWCIRSWRSIGRTCRYRSSVRYNRDTVHRARVACFKRSCLRVTRVLLSRCFYHISYSGKCSL